MANIVLISVVLVGFYSMATEAGYQEMMGKSVCEYIQSPEDCKVLRKCLNESGYTVNNPCDENEIQAANINKTCWPKICVCNWKESGLIEDDGTCNKEMQKEAIANKMTFDKPETEKALIDAVDYCNKKNEDDCVSSLFCVTMKSMKICYPDAKFPEENASHS